MELILTDVRKIAKNEERFDIQEYLRRVDKKFYHRAIENRKKEGKVFPHRGEDGRLFANTYRYLSLNK